MKDTIVLIGKNLLGTAIIGTGGWLCLVVISKVMTVLGL